ncbi:YdeI/OmpD-associated family protein [Actinokineospora sp. NBRC 105648]|uniref:YdeI/OmpD-associated family protein n=1 Tax=Actinokineospora sp. NBRC 105648 TaxID=3032206 RepID=UPI0024A29B27|nr:YdeI/OmpD-associated family protein [Actinokineospora sp. NBRC 105648]GLZ43486.1 hypothetical protein Acsp05_71100 [Actinokineospora sp. NBRC 105648]
MAVVSVRTTAEWRAWLADNHDTEREVWLVIQHKDSATPSPRYHEAIEHALCFGWIDSHARKHDAGSSVLRFSPRTPNSTWSRVNRGRAAAMTERGLMTEPGAALIELAKAKGTWQVLTDEQSTVVPDDLAELLDRDGTAVENFARLSPSARRLRLEWIATAKRPETRRRRITRTVADAAAGFPR